MNTGNSKPKRNNQRTTRGGKMRGNVDKGIFTEGVYNNPRLTHSASALIGCNVQVQVKNGTVYEGIFRTFSPKMEVVLEMAHVVEAGQTLNSVPPQERIVEKVIFNLHDITMLTALNVDLDYAIKDTFTDTAISGKHNLNGELEKELQPWEADAGGMELDLEDGRSSGQNGWDPNEMFRVNNEKFQVESSYDSSLAQYTTPLDRKNTAEYKERERNAARLAAEIERDESSKHRLNLENGDEEMLYSAVIRDGENTEGGAPTGGAVIEGKYVPPHLRKSVAHGRAIPRVPGSGSTPSPPQGSPNKPLVDTRKQINGGVDSNIEEKLGNSPEKVAAAAANSDLKNEDKRPNNKDTSPDINKKARNQQIQELRSFQETFKLSDTKSEREKKTKEKETPLKEDPQIQQQQQQQQQQLQQDHTEQPQQSQQQYIEQQQQQTQQSHTGEELRQEDTQRQQDSEKTEEVESVKHSTLNPNAKEFVFNPTAKPFIPKQEYNPVPTPPRPQTQSPVIQPQPQFPTMPYQPMNMNYIIQPQQQPQQQRFPRPGKTAVVSVNPTSNFSQNPANVTGQPIVLGNPVQGQPQGVPTILYNMGSNVRMPLAAQLMPQFVQQQQQQQQQQQSNGESQQTQQQQQQSQQQQIQQTQQQPTQYYIPQGGIPTHVQMHPQPAHLPNPQGSQHQQGAQHIPGQPPHPSPSPVHVQPQGPPPQSGTPQLMYQPGPPQQQHIPQQHQQHPTQHIPNPQAHPQAPSLQPSPNTPTSPHSIHNSQGYNFATYQQQPPQQQMAPQMTMAHTGHTNPQQTSTPHAQTPQIVMMPPTPQQLQQPTPQQHQPPPQPAHQFNPQQVNMQGHSQATMAPPTQHTMVAHPQGIMTSTASNVHPQMHYSIHQQVHTQAPQQMAPQQYQHNQ